MAPSSRRRRGRGLLRRIRAGVDAQLAAVAAMAEVGIDIAARLPGWTDDIVRAADVVVTMGCGDTCPVFPGKRYEDWELADPAGQPIEVVRRSATTSRSGPRADRQARPRRPTVTTTGARPVEDAFPEHGTPTPPAPSARTRLSLPPVVRQLTAEFIGTAFLVAGVVGSGIMAERLTDDPGLQLLRTRPPPLVCWSR